MISYGNTAIYAAVLKHDPKARIVRSIDDFAYVKESIQLLAAQDLGVVDKISKRGA